jgi:hypothetical protein
LIKGKLCLFTAHAPTGGGGGAILRSLVAALQDDWNIAWKYLSTQPVTGYEPGWLGLPVIGAGSLVGDARRTALLLAGFQSKAWRDLVTKVLSVECDAYWIVSHNEGLCLARDLGRRTKRPIHLTVHDDWAGALCARSQRYRLLAPLAGRVTDSVLRKVRSVDVVSEGMRRYYLDRTGVDSGVVHRPLPWQEVSSTLHNPNEIRVGHLGSIYSKHEFLVFVEALKAYCVEQGCDGKLILWGSHLRPTEVPPDLAAFVELRPTADEKEVLRALRQCCFVYAMYPFASKLQTFVRTSLPTKLTTYVMAQRPILGQAPKNSTLATFLLQTKLGSLWSDLDPTAGKEAIAEAMRLAPTEHEWKQARDAFFGESNVERMRSALRVATAHAAP